MRGENGKMDRGNGWEMVRMKMIKILNHFNLLVLIMSKKL